MLLLRLDTTITRQVPH